jgi:hypothetical protein
MYRCGGAEKSTEGDGDAASTVANAVKEGDGEEEEDVNAAAALPQAVAPVGAPNVYLCVRRRGEGGMRRRRGYYVFPRGSARGSAKRGGGGSLRHVASLYQIGLLCREASVP